MMARVRYPKLVLYNQSHATALNCHGQKYAIFESVDGDKKEPTDGATWKKDKKIKIFRPAGWTAVDIEKWKYQMC